MMPQEEISTIIPRGDALVVVPGPDGGVEGPGRWLAPFSAALGPDRTVWLWCKGEREREREREKERERGRGKEEGARKKGRKRFQFRVFSLPLSFILSFFRLTSSAASFQNKKTTDLPPSARLPDAVLPALSAACSAAARAGQPMADFVPVVPRLAGRGGGSKVWRVLGGGGGNKGEEDNGDDDAPLPSPSSAPSPAPVIASVAVGSEEQREEASALARRLGGGEEGCVSVAVVVVKPSSEFPPSLPPVSPAAAISSSAAASATTKDPPPPLPPFDQVAVGGTFDRLHAGHRLLLAASALAAEQRLFIGVTGDKLLSKKKHAELLQPFSERSGAAVAYARKVRPEADLRVDVGSLLDPKEPTGAETEEGMQALVVSKETVSGGEAINAGRARRGFRPLALLVVGLVGSDGGGGRGGNEEEEVEAKISSTDLRAAEAAKKK